MYVALLRFPPIMEDRNPYEIAVLTFRQAETD